MQDALHNTMSLLTEWVKGYMWGFISFPVVYYVIKNFGSTLWQDAKGIFNKATSGLPTQTAVPSLTGPSA